MGKEHAEAQIAIPAASQERQASWRTPQRFEQPRLVATDGDDFAWPEGKQQAAHIEIPIFLKALGERMIAITVGQELSQENRQLREERDIFADKAEKYDRYRQQSRDSYFRIKNADLEAQREKWRVTKAMQRAQKKQELQSQDGQNQQEDRS